MPYTFIPNLRVLVPRDASREAEALLVNERADHVNTPVAGKAEVWIKSGATQALMVTDDTGVDRTVPDSTGTGSINATYYDERADHVNTPTAGKAEIWILNTAVQSVKVTDDAGVDTFVPLITGTPVDNGLLVSAGTGGRTTSEADILYVSPKLTVQGTGGGEISMLQRGTPPAGVTNYGSYWTSDEIGGPRPAFTREDGTDYFLGYKEKEIHGALEFGGAQDQWHTWPVGGWAHTELWADTSGLGTGADPDLQNVWQYNGIYFPKAATLIEVSINLYWPNAAASSFDFQLRGVIVQNTDTTAGTESDHASLSFVMPSSAQVVEGVLTINDATVPADSKLFFCHNRGDASPQTGDPRITVHIAYVETV